MINLGSVIAEVSVLGFLAILSFFSAMPVMLLGLRFGFKDALSAGALAIGLLLIGSLVLGGQVINILGPLTQLVAVLIGIRYFLLSRSNQQTEEWYPVGYILVYFAVIAAFIALVTILLIEDGSKLISEDTLEQLARSTVASSSAQQSLIDTIKRALYFYPAINGISVVLLVIFNAALSQKLLELGQQNIRPSGAFLNISLPGYYIWIFAAALVAAIVGIMGQIGSNLLIVLALPFFFVGLSLVHSLFQHFKLGRIALGIFYLTMILFGWLIILVTVLGMCAPWLQANPDFFRKLKG